MDQADEKTITLRKPVSVGDLTYTELNLREPTAAEWVEINKHVGIEADIYAVSVLSGVPQSAVRKIGARDLATGAEFISGFFKPDRPSGAS